jgi:hypothetical protein
MFYKGLRSHFIRLTSISLATAGLFSLATPTGALILDFDSSPRTYPRTADFEKCANNLLDVGISDGDAASACANALHPVSLSRCVIRIQGSTEIIATDALSGCLRVRQPTEMSRCVVRINTEREDAIAMDVLDHCRRSLLPSRFSACVIGLGREISMPTSDAMSTCIAAYDRPDNLLPNFIPRTNPSEQPVRLTPLVPMQ